MDTHNLELDMHAEKVKLNYKLQSLFFIQAMHVPTEVNYLVMLNLLKLKKYYYPHQLGQCYYRITGYSPQVQIFPNVEPLTLAEIFPIASQLYGAKFTIQTTDPNNSHELHFTQNSVTRVQELRDSDDQTKCLFVNQHNIHDLFTIALHNKCIVWLKTLSRGAFIACSLSAHASQLLHYQQLQLQTEALCCLLYPGLGSSKLRLKR